MFIKKKGNYSFLFFFIFYFILRLCSHLEKHVEERIDLNIHLSKVFSDYVHITETIMVKIGTTNEVFPNKPNGKENCFSDI